MKKVKCTEIWHPFHNLQDIVSGICNIYNSLPESLKEMIAFEYNAIYNNSSVCMKLKTAGNTFRINKSIVFIFTVAFYRDKILLLIILDWLH